MLLEYRQLNQTTIDGRQGKSIVHIFVVKRLFVDLRLIHRYVMFFFYIYLGAILKKQKSVFKTLSWNSCVVFFHG